MACYWFWPFWCIPAYWWMRWANGNGCIILPNAYAELAANFQSNSRWTSIQILHFSRTIFHFWLKIIFRHSKSLAIVGLAVGVIFLYFDTNDSRDRLRSLSGVFILFGLGYLFSKHPSKVEITLCFFSIEWSSVEFIKKKYSTFPNYETNFPDTLAPRNCRLCSAILARPILHTNGDWQTNIQLYGTKSVSPLKFCSYWQPFCVRRSASARTSYSYIFGNFESIFQHDKIPNYFDAYDF